MSQQFANVGESWPIYDSLVVSNTFYGSESVEQGWFNSMANFSNQETHSFYKQRTAGSIGQAYTNKRARDILDFAYQGYSFGVLFKAPITKYLYRGGAGAVDTQMSHWWETELPRHCSIQLKVQQDIVAELPCTACPAGYGTVLSGAAANHENADQDATPGEENPEFSATMLGQFHNGAPSLTNRWSFPKKIGIPRGATVEAILTVSEYARGIISNWNIGTANYRIVGVDAQGDVEYAYMPARFMIQVSMLGKRMVQQRAQYHN